MGKTVNRRRVMYAVTFSEHEVETPLEVLEAFIDWTHKKHLKSYIEIGKMLHVRDGKRKNFLVKKLVADAFLEAPQANEKLIHVDGNPENNCVENLKWQKKAQRKRNIYRFEDNKTGEVFEGSISDCCDAWGLTKTALLCRANKGRVTKTLIGVKGLRTFTNIETGEKFHGTKQQAREHFHISWSTLYDKINSGLIQMWPEDETINSEDKISDPATKRLLNQYYLKKANELGCEVAYE